MSRESVIVDAVVRRFLPACGGVLLSVLAASAIADPGGLSMSALRVAGVEVVLMTAGFAAALGLLRPTALPQTGLGRRSIVAGLATPFALGALSIFTQGASLPSIAVLSASAGVLGGFVTVATGFVRRRHPPPLDPEVQAALEQLDQELGLGTPEARVAGALPRTVVTVLFQEEGNHTRLTLTQTGFDSAASRDGHREGWSSTLDRLALLAEADPQARG